MVRSLLEDFEERIGMTFEEWFHREHWEREKPLKKISEEIGFPRQTVTRWAKRRGLTWRTIAEDNNRRYKNMTEEEIKKQTQAANKIVRKYGFPSKKGKPAAWIESDKAEEIRKKISDNMKKNNPMQVERYREKASESLVKLFRASMLEQERVVFEYLEGTEHRFIHQYRIGRYITDFYFPEKNLIVEIDTFEHWGGDRYAKMAVRDKFLNEKGYKVVHIDKRDALKSPEIIEKYL